MKPPKIRVELFFKTPQQLQERVRFLASQGVNAYNLVNKNESDNLCEWYKMIKGIQRDANICLHYSLKYNKVKRGSVNEHFNRLQEFLQTAPTDAEILLVSGSTSTKSWNTVEALRMLQSKRQGRKVAIAFNPFFPSQQERDVEYKRLDEKLSTGQVSKVYLQFGTDLSLLQQGLSILRKHNVPVAASVFLPTKQLIAQQKFRPWKGVYMSDQFLSGPDQAHNVVVDIVQTLTENNAELLLEAPGVRTQKDLDLVNALVQKVAATTANAQDNFRKPKNVKETNTNGSVSTQVEPAVNASLLDKPAILLFGSHDLRLVDNEAVLKACCHKQVLPVFLWNTAQDKWGVRGCTEVILKDALRRLCASLEKYQIPVLLKNTDDPVRDLCSLAREVGTSAVYWNREFTPCSRVVDAKREAELHRLGVEAITCMSSLLYDVEKLNLSTGFQGGHWGTLMPFLRACKKQFGEPRRPYPSYLADDALKRVKMPRKIPEGCAVDDLKLAIMPPNIKWDKPILQRFQMDRNSALLRLDEFMANGLPRYESDRSRADDEFATSQLSAHLRFGVLSPNELYWRTEDSELSYSEKKTFVRRLIWRELAYFQLFTFPSMTDRSIRQHYEQTEWTNGEEAEKRLRAWKQGKTGYPIVDAGMRELYATGWMTQSVRMVVASFLVEYLRLDWKHGLEWFHFTLADADQAINSMMWQNAGRSGIDQWNFVLSPETASQDATGAYTRKWVPELAKLPAKYLHRPWQTFEGDLRVAGVSFGETYPRRIVKDLKFERSQSVESVLKMRRKSQEFNDNKGYDLIELPNGQRTVVFTKKEYRIDREGKVIQQSKASAVHGKKGGGSPVRKRRRTQSGRRTPQ